MEPGRAGTGSRQAGAYSDEEAADPQPQPRWRTGAVGTRPGSPGVGLMVPAALEDSVVGELVEQ